MLKVIGAHLLYQFLLLPLLLDPAFLAFFGNALVTFALVNYLLSLFLGLLDLFPGFTLFQLQQCNTIGQQPRVLFCFLSRLLRRQQLVVYVVLVVLVVVVVEFIVRVMLWALFLLVILLLPFVLLFVLFICNFLL